MMKFFLIIFFLLMCCNQENFNQNKNAIQDKTKSYSVYSNVKDTLSNTNDEQSYQNDPIFKKLFVLRFYDNYMTLDKSKDLTLVNNQADTSIAFNFSLKNNTHSRKVKEFLIDNRTLFPSANSISSGAFFLNNIKLIDDNTYLGILIEYAGFERILYGYGKLNIKDKNLFIESLYFALDRTGIGRITYDHVIKVNNGDYCIVGNNKGEGHQSISLHYFPRDYRNKTYLIEKCNPSSEANPHDEKLEYNIDYKNKIITIEKFEMERDKESDWRKLSSNRYNILDLIEQLKK